MRQLQFFLFLCLISSTTIAQQSSNFWSLIDASDNNKSITLEMNKSEMLERLMPAVKINYNLKLNDRGIELSLPNADGSFEKYEVFRTEVMHPKLAQKYPMIQTFIGLSQEVAGKQIRFSISHKRFEGMILSPTEEAVYISHITEDEYACYKKSNYQRPTGNPQFVCGVGDSHVVEPTNATSTGGKFAGDCNLRTYRLALACTGEYAQFHGGNIPDVLEEMVVSMVRVNGIYETDFGITMVLIANNDELIFLNSGSDPYNNNNGGTMLGQNQTTIDDIIGTANYDIGHVYSTGGGGIANLQAPCNPNRKARGVTGLGFPTGDAFWVDYVAHEMGHQFGGNHTQNNSCQRNGPTAVEPGSASTIMGYAGICNPNVQNNSDDHFHAISIQEITNYSTLGEGNSCPVISDTGNNAPFIQAGQSVFDVPVDTRFRLTVDAGDEDEDDQLTYCWEQMDNEVADMPPSPFSTVGPAFRSISPSQNPTRYFPNIQAILSNNSPTWEVIPSVSRNMDFRCTVRDNHPLNGCTAETDVTVRFHQAAGPFLVTSQNSSEEWYSYSEQTVTWDVAGTDVAPVETPMVDILLSTDGGLTYPTIVSEGIPNTGSAQIVVPNVETTQGRIMVVGHQNIFFDINNVNINIIRASFSLDLSPQSVETCDADEVSLTVDYQEFEAFEEVVSLSTSGLPAELTVSFDQEMVNDPAQVNMNITGLSGINPGTYPFQVIGMSENQTFITSGELKILSSTLATPFLEQPADGEIGAGKRPTFDWIQSGNVQSYELELATNPSFGSSIIYSNPDAQAGTPISMDLELQTVYYWRIYASNSCATERAESAIYRFQTGLEGCTINDGLIQPQTITPNSITSTKSLTNITNGEEISSLKVSTLINHSLIGDLSLRLETPSGQIFELANRPGVPATPLGCLEDNMDVSFSDGAPNSAEDFENTCDSNSGAAISGEFQPVDPLSDLVGTNSAGVWFFEVIDFKAGDGGEMTRWALEICSLMPPSETLEVVTDTIYVSQGFGLTITEENIMATDADPTNLRYTLTALPAFGTLELSDMDGNQNVLNLGDVFTQDDIVNNRLRFESFDVETFDSFEFDALNSSGIWSPANKVDVKIYGPSSTDNEIEDVNVSISPNPGNGVFNLFFNSTQVQDLDYQIFDISGKLLSQDRLNIFDKYTHRMDLSDLQDGMYLLVIRNEQQEQNSYRLVKQ